MDFSALIKKSFEIAWRNKVLWLFGFLSGGVGGAGAMNPSGFNFTVPATTEPSGEELETASRVLGVSDSSANLISSQAVIILVLAVAALILILLLVGIFVSNWAGAALVFSILQRDIQKPTFGAGARAGLKYWWKFYLLGLLLALVFLTLIVMLATPAIFLFLTKLKIVAIVYSIVAVIILIIALFVISIIGTLIVTIAQRMIIHKGTGVLESVRLSGGLIKKHKGESFLTYLVAIGLNFAAGIVLFIAMLPLIVIFVVLVLFKLWWLLIIAAIPVLVIFFAAGGFLQTFNASFWTLFYEHLAAKEGW